MMEQLQHDRYYKLLYDVLRSYKRCTPKNICQLRNRQIFVFGTDKKGSQRQGAAWLAANRFGASVGVTDGLSGRAYALPTQGFSIEQLADAVRRFEEFARANPSFEFLVTPVGCGHAGFKIEEVAPLFQDCVGLMNVMLPEDFIRYFRMECIHNLEQNNKEQNIPQDTMDVYSFYDDSLHDVISFLKDNNIPFNPDGGFTLTDEQGSIIAEAELGIESEKIVFLPFNSQSELTFKNAGYTIMDVDSYLKRKKK
jgi:hypothetical protein